MNGVLGHDFALLRLHWTGDNLGRDEFCNETCPWRRIDRLTCWAAVQHTTTTTMDHLDAPWVNETNFVMNHAPGTGSID